MATNILTTIVAPALGALMGNVMWLSPMKDVLKAYKNEFIGELNPLPFSATTFSALMWIYYAKLKKDYFIFIGNIFGLGLGIFYTLVSLYLLGINKNSKTSNSNATDYVFYTFVISIFGPVLQNSYTFLFDSYMVNQENSQLIVGISATIAALMYFSLPCYTLKEVIEKKDASSIQKNMIIANAINCLAWSTYGLAINDPWLYAINLIGLLLATINFGAKLHYPSVNDISDNSDSGGSGSGSNGWCCFGMSSSNSNHDTYSYNTTKKQDIINDTC